jgi:uncharacterized membrane protein
MANTWGVPGSVTISYFHLLLLYGVTAISVGAHGHGHAVILLLLDYMPPDPADSSPTL